MYKDVRLSYLYSKQILILYISNQIIDQLIYSSAYLVCFSLVPEIVPLEEP